MDKVLEKAKELRFAIEETGEYQEYIKNKELLEKSEDVIELKHNIANLSVDEFTPPLFLSFFVISGASIDFSVINSLSIVLVALIYIVVRSLGKYSGAYLGSLVSKAEPNVRNYLGITLLPQAGVAIGMANMAKAAFDIHGSNNGDIIYTIVLTATLVYELVGPMLTKIALEKANEIDKNTSLIGKHRLVKHHRIKEGTIVTK